MRDEGGPSMRLNRMAGFEALVRSSERSGASIDTVVVTTRSQAQSDTYARQVETLQSRGCLPAGTRFLFPSDPPTGAVGSGGALLLALEHVAGVLGSGWLRGRSLLVHAGGEGRRLPAALALGKLMTLLPIRDASGRCLTLLECIYRSLAPLTMRLPPGVLTAGGDVLAAWDLDQMESLPRTDAVAFCGRGRYGQVRNHALYVLDGQRRRVETILQKAPEEAVVRSGAVEDGCCTYDMAGLVYLRPRSVAKLVGALDAAAGPSTLRDWLARGVLLDQWYDLTLPMARRTDVASYRAGGGPVPEVCREALWHQIRASSSGGLGAVEVGEHMFAHLGSVTDLLGAAAGEPGARCADSGASRENHRLCSVTAPGASLAPGSWISECRVGRSEIGQCSFAQGVSVGDGAKIPPETAVFGVPLLGGPPQRFVVGCFGLADDLRASVDDPDAVLCGRPVASWFEGCGGLPADLIPSGEPRTLWHARLFPVVDGEPNIESLSPLLTGSAHQLAREWSRRSRISLAEALRHVDYRAAQAWREQVGRDEVLDQAPQAVGPGRSARVLASRLSPGAERGRLRDALRSLGEGESDPLRAARCLAGASVLASEQDEHEALAAALAKVAEACAMAAGAQAPPLLDEPVRPALVLAPARADLAGGWTDTPPQSMEIGGRVVNVALTVNGRYPIAAYGTPIEETHVCLRHEPTGHETVVQSSHDLQTDLSDPFCLLKSVLLHLWPLSNGEDSLRQACSRWRRGFRLSVRSWLPHGSGLGTSSIMALAALRAAHELFGVSAGHADVVRSVMHIEQLMTSGGGWQDQVGALHAGLKCTTTAPGLLQVPVSEAAADGDGFSRYMDSHAVLYFVGNRRTAMPILKDIVLNYLRGEGEIAECLEALYANATELWEHLQAARWHLLGPLMSVYREIVTRMCPPAMSVPMRELVTASAPYCTGVKMVGAGGGGFMLFLTRTPHDTQKLEDLLRPRSWRGLGRRYSAAVAPLGCHTVDPTADAVYDAIARR